MTKAPEKAPPAQRARRLSRRRTLAIALAVPAIGIAALVTLRDTEPSPSRFSVTETGEAETDRLRGPLAAELARCRTVAADAVDERCHAAWEAHRRHFLGERRRAVPTDTPAPAVSPNPEGR